MAAVLAWDAPLTAEEEEGLKLLDIEMRCFVVGHEPTQNALDLRVSGPIWTLDCRRGCGQKLTYSEFAEWIDRNGVEWATGSPLQSTTLERDI